MLRRPLLFIMSLCLATALVIGIGYSAHDDGVAYQSVQQLG